MEVTISSILTICLIDSFLIVILCLLSKSSLVMKKFGPGCMIILLLMAACRMFLPFEFPFTYSLRIEDVLTVPRRIFAYVIISEPYKVTVWMILILLWIAGIIGNMIYKLYAYHEIIRCISICDSEKWEDLCRTYQLDITQYEGMETIKVICNSQFSAPYLIGLRQPYLMLPDVIYDKEQFRYILLHEWMHVKHKDILWKLLIELLCAIFWWNPAFRYLKKELFQLIEMRNDMQIVSYLSKNERIDYMECLTDTALQIAGKDVTFGVAFSKSNVRELARRIELIADSKTFSRWMQMAAGGVAAILLIMSFLVVAEPYSNDAPEGTPMTEENGFLIKNGFTYDVYLNGKYMYTTDNIEGFPDVKIYKNIQEVEENE